MVGKKEAEAEDINLLQKKAQYFYEGNIPVHIKFKDKHWLRGKIKSVSADFFILEEYFEGSICVFFLELIDIAELREKK